MADGIVYAILGKIGEYLVAPIGRQFGYVCCYNNIIQNLKDEGADLENMRAAEKIRVARAKNNAEEINPVLVAWLTKEQEIKTQSERILEDAANVGKGWSLNLKSRYLVSKRATKKTREVVELQGKGKFEWISCRTAPSAVMPAPSTSIDGSTDFGSRMSTRKQVIEAIKNDEINMIVICGIGGVGKTTMVNQVKARAEVRSLFDDVVMTVVSQTQDIFKIQSELGSLLGLKFDEGIGIHARADMLRTRLASGKRILVVLDDVWDPLDLHEVGIPVGGGCKLVLTSRNERVYIEMGTQKKIIFSLQILAPEEALDLFNKKAEIGVDTPHTLYDIAEEVARECAGLPLAIVTVATALKIEKYMHGRTRFNNSETLV